MSAWKLPHASRQRGLLGVSTCVPSRLPVRSAVNLVVTFERLLGAESQFSCETRCRCLNDEKAVTANRVMDARPITDSRWFHVELRKGVCGNEGLNRHELNDSVCL